MGELSENAFFRTFLCPFLCFSPSRYELFLEKNVAKIKMIEKTNFVNAPGLQIP